MTRLYLSTLAVAILAAGYACAGDITMDPDPFVSLTSRAQVQQELAQFQQGAVNPWADGYNPLAEFHSSTSRAFVTADFLASRDSVAAFSGEDSGSSYLARMNAPAARHGTELATAN
jgi:hypothetical protein